MWVSWVHKGLGLVASADCSRATISMRTTAAQCKLAEFIMTKAQICARNYLSLSDTIATTEASYHKTSQRIPSHLHSERFESNISI